MFEGPAFDNNDGDGEPGGDFEFVVQDDLPPVKIPSPSIQSARRTGKITAKSLTKKRLRVRSKES